MKPDCRKNVKLKKQYSFVDTIAAMRLGPLARTSPNQQRLDDLTIKVEKADGDLLFRKGSNIGLKDTGCLITTKSGSRRVGKQGEYLFAIDADDEIINMVRWPRSRKEARGKYPTYGYSVLWGTKHRGGLSDPLWDRVEYLVWVTVTAWYDPTGDYDNPWGEIQTRTMKVTIYRKPNCGFEKLQEKANVYDNLYLNSQTLIEGALTDNFDLVAISGRLDELCTTFQDEVYFNGMKPVLDKGRVRGASGVFGSVKVLAAEMCGYDRVMLEDKASWISFQLRPGSKRMYVHGCGGTLPQLRRMIREAIDFWRNPGNRTGFKPDEEVSVL